MSRLRNAAKATVVTQLFHWTALLLSLATVPLYLAWLGSERYGLLLTGIAISSYLMFSDAGINWASMLLISQADGRGDREGIAAIFRSSFPLAAGSAVLVAVITGGLVWVVQRGGIDWLPSHPEFPGLLLAVGGSVLVNLGLAPFFNLLIGLQDTQIAAAYQGLGRLAGTAGTVVIAGSGASLGWVYSGNVAGTLLAGIFTVLHCLRGYRWAFRRGPFCEPAQLFEQLRTGARSLLMQAGNVLWGTAPVMAISLGAGAQFVPLYSIPMTLLNAPLGVVSTFSATLQPGYGEAMGRGEFSWIAETLGRILRHGLIVIGLISCGFLLLAPPFIRLWTADRIDPGRLLLAGVLTLASVQLALSVLRYALTGINRHRNACAGEIAGGALAMGVALLLARGSGYEWSIFAVAAVALASSGWILPLELKRSLPGQSFMPPAGFCLRCLAACGFSFGIASLSGRFLPTTHPWLDLILRGAIITFSYAASIRWLLPGEARTIVGILFRRKRPGP
jgi:O-antigen/teichoic acid export membrane protein